MNDTNIKAIAFDFDGVICQTDICHAAAWDDLCKYLNVALAPDERDKLNGLSRMACLKLILGDETYRATADEELDRLASLKNKYFLEYVNKMKDELLDSEALEAMAILRDNGFQLAIASSSKNAGNILNSFAIERYFNVIVDGNQISLPKPSPEVYIQVARRLGLQPSSILAVEDSPSGVQSAIAAAMQVITFRVTDEKYHSRRADSLLDIIPYVCCGKTS